MRPFVVATVCLTLAGCVTEVPLQTPVGTWRGTGFPGHPDAQYIRRFAEDQSFVLEYCGAGRRGHVERGHWSFGNGGFTLDTELVDRAHAKFEDVYQTDSYDGSNWGFTLTSSNSAQDDVDNDYTVRRVSDAMQFTGCP